jgi:hypothetical protein
MKLNMRVFFFAFVGASTCFAALALDNEAMANRLAPFGGSLSAIGD